MTRTFLWAGVAALALLAPGTGAADTVTVEVSGVDGPLRDNVVAFLAIAGYSERDSVNPVVIRRLHREAAAQAAEALQPFGHYHAKVASSLELTDGRWLATYAVTPGEPTLVRTSDVRLAGAGAEGTAFRKALREYRLAPGVQLNHQQYDGLKTRLRSTAARLGYFDARFTAAALRVHPDARAADIELHFDTGERYRFGDIRIDQSAVDDALMQRYLIIESGDPYDADKLLDMQFALLDSNYFAYVSVSAPQREARNGVVPVVIVGEPGKRQRYTAGFGYGTDTGARGSLGWQNRRVNGRGHRLRLSTRLSEIRQNVTADYIIPQRRPATDRLTLGGGLFEDQLGDTESTRSELGVTQTITRRRLQFSRYVRLLNEETVTGDDVLDSRLVLPGVSVSRTRSDSAIFPSRGSRYFADLRGSHTALGSDANFVRLQLEARFIRRLGRNARLLLRADAGTVAVDATTDLPASQRFFAGGDLSVRGYDFQELGSVDDEGAVIGGKNLLTGSVELEYLPWGNWGFAVFVDAGNAGERFADGLEYAAGLGLRWRSPVGIVRFDIGQSLSQSDRSPTLHFGIGPDL
ncbi:MAG: autotransporter assembly complex family protein [Pseudomonadota bacterium]